MTSPISVGDVYLMAKLAFQLGRAFTKGRNSAPAEFREVEKQLYSLSVVLEAFKTESRDGSITLRVDKSALPVLSQPRYGEDKGEEDVLAHVLRSCEQTLAHLESIVRKYGIIGKPRVSSARQPILGRWNDSIKHAWRSISWTTEGGDLATLRSNLAVHTNSLNLLLGVIVKSQTGRIEARVNNIDFMLHEIHAWFTENLEDSCLNTRDDLRKGAVGTSKLDFELYEDDETQSRLVCPHAVLNPNFPVHEVPASHHELFACQCSTPSDGLPSHRAEVAGFARKPIQYST
ncbi:hypothetical protein McanMca71_001161 [Microsporum canis]